MDEGIKQLICQLFGCQNIIVVYIATYSHGYMFCIYPLNSPCHPAWKSVPKIDYPAAKISCKWNSVEMEKNNLFSDHNLDAIILAQAFKSRHSTRYVLSLTIPIARGFTLRKFTVCGRITVWLVFCLTGLDSVVSVHTNNNNFL